VLHHGEHLDLLEEVLHRDGVNSVPQGSAQGLFEGLVRAVQQPVSDLDIICLIWWSDILVPRSLEVLEVFLVAPSTNHWAWYLSKKDFTFTTMLSWPTNSTSLLPMSISSVGSQHL
jgi:hypothetical protein